MEKEKVKQIIIKATKEYEMFEHLPYNRKVMPNHVEKLKRSINRSNELKLEPIVVTDKMEVIDGQHRLAAAKELNVPIYYVVDDDFRPEKIMLMNSSQKNWSIENFIEYWVQMGKSDYQVLKMHKENFNLSYDLLLEWLYTDNRGKLGNQIRMGDLVFPENPKGLEYLKKAYVVMEILKDQNFKPVKIYTQRAFHIALRKMFSSPFVDEERFYEKLKSCPHRINCTFFWHDYIDQFAAIYNYRVKTDVIKIVKHHQKLELIK